MAAEARLAPIMMGFAPVALASSSNTTALNAAGTWLAWSFVSAQARTINEVWWYCAAVNGTLGSSDLVCAIYSDNNGVPGSSLSSTSTVATTPTGAAWVHWTGLSQATTAGTQYWIVLQNANGTPGTNYPTFYKGSTNELGSDIASATTWGYVTATTTNSGTSWSSPQAGTGGPRILFADGTYAGFPIQSYTRPSSIGSGQGAFGVQEVGNQFSVPANGKLNVIGIACALCKNGSPGALRYRLYNGTTLLATTETIPAANVGTGNGPWYIAYFSSPVAIDSTMTLYAMIGDATAGDTSGNYYAPWVWTTQADAHAEALMPLDGTMQYALCSNNASPSFTVTANQFIPMLLVLDPNGEFQAGGGGSGVSLARVAGML